MAVTADSDRANHQILSGDLIAVVGIGAYVVQYAAIMSIYLPKMSRLDLSSVKV